jgi:hypothetical protein
MVPPRSIQRDMRNAHPILVKILDGKGGVGDIGVYESLIFE